MAAELYLFLQRPDRLETAVKRKEHQDFQALLVPLGFLRRQSSTQRGDVQHTGQALSFALAQN
jgi:hypothetical protein